VQLELDPPTLAAVQAQVRRLGDDGEIGDQLFALDQIVPAQAVAVLFHDGVREV
jgi:hypothetical protein